MFLQEFPGQSSRNIVPPRRKAGLAFGHKASIKTKVLVIDDHPIFREGLRKVINSEPDLTVCGEAEGAAEALAEIKALRPDIVIVDITLHQSSGIDLIKDMKLRWPNLPILVLSNHDEALYAERCVRTGARGYVMKTHSPQELLAGLRDVLRGKFHLSDAITNKILNKYIYGSSPDNSNPFEQLSDREIQVFELYGKGRTTRQISEILHLSVKTVESHRDGIKEKLDFADSTSLVRAAVQWVESQHGL
jgi:DNA-binding NarL/FixJ family response regulator